MRFVAGNKVIQNVFCCTTLYSFKYKNVFNEFRSPQLGAVGQLRSNYEDIKLFFSLNCWSGEGSL